MHHLPSVEKRDAGGKNYGSACAKGGPLLAALERAMGR